MSIQTKEKEESMRDKTDTGGFYKPEKSMNLKEIS
jgi:hypothetical protein